MAMYGAIHFTKSISLMLHVMSLMLRALSLIFHGDPRRAGMQGRKQTISMFQKLPTELIVLVMCHTRSSDLVELIRTEKSMNEIFECHKISIFRRMQIYQFPEFSGWFGDLPGFDGSTLGNSRTSEQVECLKDVVFSLKWQYVYPAFRRDINNEVFLPLLERYGGWRYLTFLHGLKYNMEREAQKLERFTYNTVQSMNARSAKAMVLCLSRMSYRAAKAVVSTEDEDLEAMPARVENRLRIFRQQPRALQNGMIRTLRLLIYRMAIRLQLDHTLRRACHYYQPGGPTPIQTKEDFHILASEIMTKLLLRCIFHYGVDNTMLLCEEPVNEQVSQAQTWIQVRFDEDLVYATMFGTFGAVANIDPNIQEGSLWAEGIGFPTYELLVVGSERINRQTRRRSE